MTRAAIFGVLIALASDTGCGGSAPPRERADDSDVVIQVINNGWNDMDVYAYMGAAGRWLGMATGHSVSAFRIPWRRLHRVSRFRLSVDPVGTGDRWFSGVLLVEPGSLVTWTLQPNLDSSTISVH